MNTQEITVAMPEHDDPEFDAKVLAVVAEYTGVTDFTRVLQLAARITVVTLTDEAKRVLKKKALLTRLGLHQSLGEALVTQQVKNAGGAIASEVWTYVVANGVVRVKFYADDIEFIFVKKA